MVLRVVCDSMYKVLGVVAWTCLFLLLTNVSVSASNERATVEDDPSTVNVLVTVSFPPEHGQEPTRFWFPLPTGAVFGLVYRHSVEQTMVEEWIGVTSDGDLVMQEMRYQSFGAGLPYGIGQGNWVHQDDLFLWQNIGLVLGTFSVLLSLENEYVLQVSDRAFALDGFPTGTRLFFVADQRKKEGDEIGQYFEQGVDERN